jgi:hypothetical protein
MGAMAHINAAWILLGGVRVVRRSTCPGLAETQQSERCLTRRPHFGATTTPPPVTRQSLAHAHRSRPQKLYP